MRERLELPTVDAVRRLSKTNMNDASAVMQEWRRLQIVSAAVVSVPDRVQQASQSALRAPKNQSFYVKPQDVELRSDNLESLMAYSVRLSEEEKKRFEAALLERIDPDRGYLHVTDFILCALWKARKLPEALVRAKAKLPQGEMKAFGLRNTLMMLNEFLRYRYPDFPSEMLDEIERFLSGMQEHFFLILAKIVTIRAMRLRET